jgi:MOSC domain-containing protein YiiM
VSGTLERIFVAGAGGRAMQALERVQAVPGRGLVGDRYAAGLGHWTPSGDVCQVTMIGAEALEAAEARHGLALANGEHRRNLVVRGLDPHTLGGKVIRIGEARLVYDRPRPPCGYIAKLTDKRMYKALMKHGFGICLTVKDGGELASGMPVEIEGPNRDLFSANFDRFLKAFR